MASLTKGIPSTLADHEPPVKVDDRAVTNVINMSVANDSSKSIIITDDEISISDKSKRD